MKLQPETQVLLWAAIAAIVVVAVCFANSLPNDFIVDDYRIVALNPAIRTIAPLHFFKTPYWGENSHAGLYRPLTIFSFSLEYPWWRRWAGGYRLTNLLLHAINGFLVFLLVRSLFQSNPAAWAASAIYLAHPVHTEPVVALAGRSELLAAMFFLLAWISYRRGKTFLCSIAFFLSLLSKENAIAFPAVIFLERVVFHGGLRNALKEWKRFGALAATALVYLGVRFWVLGEFGIPKPIQYLQGSWTIAQRELTTGRAFLKYFQLLVAPLEVTGDYDFNSIPLATVNDWVAWAGLLLVLLTIVFAFRMLKARPGIGFAILFFYLTILPVSNWIIPTAVILSERALYLPSLGICMLAGLVWAGISNIQVRRVLGLGVMVTAALLCVAHSYIWRNDLTYFGNLIHVFPNNVRGQLGYGTALVEAGRAEEARQHFEAGLRVTRSAPLLVGLSEALLQIDRSCGLARPVLNEALSIEPADPFAPWLMAECYENDGSLVEAEASYRQAVNNSRFPEPRLLIGWGRVLEKTGKPEEAREAYRRAALLQ